MLKNNPSVAILMATYNGESFIFEQLFSFMNQRHSNWHLWVSDDGSVDSTLSLIKKTIPVHKVSFVSGPKRGYAQNFLSLVQNKSIIADFYAFSDQDDLWLPSKLSAAISELSQIDSNIPSLYCSTSNLVSETGEFIDVSIQCPLPLTFENALVQCPCSGNTMVFNNAARNLLSSVTSNVESHDWLLYLIVTAVGGVVLFDSRPSLNYRQHSSNLVGGSTNKVNKALSILKNNSYAHKLDKNLVALASIHNQILPNLQNKLAYFNKARDYSVSVIQRLCFLFKSGMYSQSWKRTSLIYLFSIIRKL